MPLSPDELTQLCEQEYEQQIIVDRLRREVYQQADPSASPEILEELVKAEAELKAIQEKQNTEQESKPESGLILETTESDDMNRIRGKETTGLEVKVHLRMAQIPTSYYHLLDHKETPLISCEVHAVENDDDLFKRVRVTSFIEGYSARAVNTFELASDETKTFDQLPTLFHDRIQNLNELTRASLNILIEDLDGNIELHQTYPIWLLARTTAPLGIKDPKTGKWNDMSRYFGAFVTPNAPSLMKFLREGADHHPDTRLIGYQGTVEEILPQVKAIFEALKHKADITYVNSVISFSPDQGFATQRVRLPRESLEDKQANCIDGTVLFASLLEGISMNPAIVIIPGHAFVAWETWNYSNEWNFLETTMIGTSTFEEACASGEKTAEYYKKSGNLELHPIQELRTKYGIMPME
ncbi:Uncharacterized protein dnl_09370 [Desulfonema limicola]|uniref:Uncharacterized protein n=1 Tax=Desulfonema limicola TaxID=45656 RepID=A0A975B4L5_9BACT|nr:hypothetical protein [Desulfonema limicola]QTA78707.1 Uncharacterized protein dnl_09370 [Desulfonema limicola]